jgi:protease-4
MIWRAQQIAKAKKPFIVSMADVAGSGGYYIAHLADVIVAEPTTLTGSIGVVSAMPNLSKTMDKLGIKVERISRGKNAGLFSPMTPRHEVNIKQLTNFMEEFYWDFVDKVADGRGMTREAIHEVAQGRVWTGKQALENGLIDALGGMDHAMEIAKLKAGFTDETDWELKEMPEAPDFFEALSESFGARMAIQEFMRAAGLNVTDRLLNEIPSLRARMAHLSTLLRICQSDSMLAVMPMDIHVDF